MALPNMGCTTRRFEYSGKTMKRDKELQYSAHIFKQSKERIILSFIWITLNLAKA
jgi:hypothetical protein